MLSLFGYWENQSLLLKNTKFTPTGRMLINLKIAQDISNNFRRKDEKRLRKRRFPIIDGKQKTIRFDARTFFYDYAQ